MKRKLLFWMAPLGDTISRAKTPSDADNVISDPSIETNFFPTTLSRLGAAVSALALSLAGAEPSWAVAQNASVVNPATKRPANAACAAQRISTPPIVVVILRRYRRYRRYATVLRTGVGIAVVGIALTVARRVPVMVVVALLVG